MKIAEVKKKYPQRWVLTKVIKEGLNEPEEVRVLKHGKSRDEIYEALKKTKAKHTFHFFTGPIPKKGYAVAFWWLTTYRSRRGSMGSWA